MTICICGSLSHFEKSLEIKKELEKKGFTVLWPYGMERLSMDIEHEKTPDVHGKAIIIHWEKIKESDVVLIVNEEKYSIDNYIGGNTLMEMGFAFVLEKPIYLLNPIPKEVRYVEEIVAMKPIVLNGDVSSISTEERIKSN